MWGRRTSFSSAWRPTKSSLDILARALEAVRAGTFSPGDPDRHAGIVQNLTQSDYFMVCSDFDDYWRTQREVDKAFRDTVRWSRSTALNTARSGWFSSDRTIRGYMADIWIQTAAPLLT